ncbi:DUF3309 domain-containing protein [Legionella sp. CNM-4043-24]|uniref:DUF3309 domain-containing protein n=1 Tax=Legionella sp. CNM-4043-24 TaxID=3421646 RepID=UPI00403B1BD1
MYYTQSAIQLIKENIMLGTIILVLLILFLLGGLPRWGYSKGWGYGPSGIIGLILVVYLILVLIGRIPLGF